MRSISVFVYAKVRDLAGRGGETLLIVLICLLIACLLLWPITRLLTAK